MLVSQTTQHVRIHVQKPDRVMLGIYIFYFTFMLYIFITLHNTQFTFTQFSQLPKEKKYFELKCKYFNMILLVWDLAVAFGKMACSGLNHLVVLMIDVEFCCELFNAGLTLNDFSNDLKGKFYEVRKKIRLVSWLRRRALLWSASLGVRWSRNPVRAVSRGVFFLSWHYYRIKHV